MPVFETSRQVPFSVNDMFDLVADVERYPEFVPLCQGLKVISRQSLGEIDVITANMTVAYKLFSETFTSRVELRRKDGVIEVTYLDGPFRRLRNVWRFTPLGEQSCRVGFYLDYEFRSRTLQMLMGAVFDKAFRKFSTAFEERAAAVYGNHEASASAPPREATITP